MRVRLSLLASAKGTRLPLNYNHAVASLVYATLRESSAEFASRLHDNGFRADGRAFKLFTFSRLNPLRCHRAGDQLVLDDPSVSFQISSPVADFIEHFVAGLFQTETFTIAGLPFKLRQAETIPAPEFSDQMRFRALSPITASVGDGQKHGRYLAPSEDWSPVIQQNLVRKYHALHGHPPADDRLRWTWDQEYLDDLSKRGRQASVLIDIRDIKVRGWLAPFTVEGSPALIALGYDAGFGKSNAMGFGFVEAIIYEIAF